MRLVLRHDAVRVKHAIQGGPADAEQLCGAKFIAVAAEQNVLDMAADHNIKPPVTKVDSG